MQLLRKISTRTVYGSKADIQALVLADRTKSHPLFRVIGFCNGSRTGATKDINEETGGPNARDVKPKTIAPDGTPMRDWTALLGGFEATNLKTNEKYRSGVCFLPNYVIDSILGQLGSGVESVKFAFDVAARFDEGSATSYIYEATSLIEPSDDDALNVLTRSIVAGLTGPKEEPKKDETGSATP